MGRRTCWGRRHWSSQTCYPPGSLTSLPACSIQLPSSSCKWKEWWFSHNQRLQEKVPLLACWGDTSLGWFVLFSRSGPAHSFRSVQGLGRLGLLLLSLLALHSCWVSLVIMACSFGSEWSHSEPPLGRRGRGHGPSTFTPSQLWHSQFSPSCPVWQPWPHHQMLKVNFMLPVWTNAWALSSATKLGLHGGS